MWLLHNGPIPSKHSRITAQPVVKALPERVCHAHGSQEVLGHVTLHLENTLGGLLAATIVPSASDLWGLQVIHGILFKATAITFQCSLLWLRAGCLPAFGGFPEQHLVLFHRLTKLRGPTFSNAGLLLRLFWVLLTHAFTLLGTSSRVDLLVHAKVLENELVVGLFPEFPNKSAKLLSWK